MKIWELHGMRLDGAIRTTPEGEADVSGLVLSEKAYLLAVRDFRPVELVELVQLRGPEAAARALSAHYEGGEVLQATGGRSLVITRGNGPALAVRRSDEVRPSALAR